MSGHFSEQLMERYCQRTVRLAELIDLDQHLTECEGCRQKLSEVARLDELYRTLLGDLRVAADEEPRHLSYEQLSAYLLGELSVDERWQVEEHLESCTACVWQTGELRVFAATISFGKTYQPPLSARERCQAFWHSLTTSTRLYLAHAPMTAMLVVTIFHPLLRSTQEWGLESNSGPSALSPPPVETSNAIVETTSTTAPPVFRSPPRRAKRVRPHFAVRLGPLVRGRGSEETERFDLRLRPNISEARIQIEQVATTDAFGNRYKSYAATLEASGNDVVWRTRGLQTRPGRAGHHIFLSLPVKQLSDGQYTLFLSGITAQGDERAVGDCQLSVSRMR
jgi:hypothetical protein